MGPSSFISTLNELKMFLKFNPLPDELGDNSDIILFHVDILKDKAQKDFINKANSIKICVGKRKDLTQSFDGILELPTSLKEINSIIENTVAKKNLI